MAKEFTYKIEEHIAVLSQNGNTTKELNIVKFGEAAPKFDIRAWYRKDGETKMLKGIALTAEEIAVLRDVLNAREDVPRADQA